MRGSAHIGWLLGIDVDVHASWILVFALFVYLFATVIFPGLYPGLTPARAWMHSGRTR